MAEKKLNAILLQYKDNPVVLQKIENFIGTILPKQIHVFLEKERRQEILSMHMKTYIEAFFSDPTTQFYYISPSNIFIHYTNGHYKIVAEDDIWHTILSDISSKKVLVDWKK